MTKLKFQIDKRRVFNHFRLEFDLRTLVLNAAQTEDVLGQAMRRI